MSNRYGKKQRRKNRQEIADMRHEIRCLNSSLSVARHKLNTAQQEAWNYLLERKGLYELAIKEIAKHFGPEISNQLLPFAEKLFNESCRGRHGFNERDSLSVTIDKSPIYTEEIMTIRLDVKRSLVLGRLSIDA